MQQTMSTLKAKSVYQVFTKIGGLFAGDNLVQNLT